jgi:hypothetical protein
MSWDKTKPGNVKMRVGRQQILDNNAALETALQRDHNFPGTVGADDGEHIKVTFHAPIAKPANEANKGFLYIKDVAGVAELHFEDEAGNEIQLTTGGLLNAMLLAGVQTVTGAKTFQADITLNGGNVVMAGSETVDGVDVSVHKAGTAKTQHDGGVGDHTHESAGAEGGLLGHKGTGTNDYLKLSNGQIVQWGTVDPGSAKTGTTNFPLTFPNACLNVIFTFAEATVAGNDQNPYISAKSTTSFSWCTGERALDFYWLAIGY